MNPCPRCGGGFPDDFDLPVCRCGSNWHSPRKDTRMSETASWLKSRENWLRVVAIPNHGGFEIALVIDGTYSLESGPKRVARHHIERIMAALEADGLPLRRPPGMGVRSLETPEEVEERRERHREAAQARVDDAIAARDVGGMLASLGEAMGQPPDGFTDLEAAYLEDEEG